MKYGKSVIEVCGEIQTQLNKRLGEIIQNMNPKLNRQRGKMTERSLAKKLNMERVGILGKEDLRGGIYVVEVKHRKKFVGNSFLEQAEIACFSPKIPIAIVHLHGQQHENDIVLIRIRDYVKVVNVASMLPKGEGKSGNDN